MFNFKIGTVLVLACVAVNWSPGDAHACSCWHLAFIWSSPEDGAQGVPLDVVPALRGGIEDLEFQRADGTPVNFARTDAADAPLSCVLNSELVPEQALEANTTYVIRARKALDPKQWIELRFTTLRLNAPLARGRGARVRLRVRRRRDCGIHCQSRPAPRWLGPSPTRASPCVRREHRLG